MAIKYSTREAIPADEAQDFEEFKEGDAVVFMHKDHAAALREAYRLKGDVTKLTEAQEAAKVKLDALAAAEAERAAAAEAERLKGLTESQRLAEQVEALTKRIGETESEYKARVAALEGEKVESLKAAKVAELSAAATPANRVILARMIRADLEFKADGSAVVLDENGKATATTLDEYAAALKTKYPSLVSAVSSFGGHGTGGAGGAQGGTVGANIAGFHELPLR